MIQPNVAAAIASMKMTSDENVAGKVPSAIAIRPCPATCEISASATSAATPPSERGSKTRLEHNRHDKQAGRRDRGRAERELAGAQAPPRGAHRQHIAPEEHGSDEPEQIASETVRREAVALAHERCPAGEA